MLFERKAAEVYMLSSIMRLFVLVEVLKKNRRAQLLR